ncbi:MAG: endonuclease V [Anaerolineae bacterium]|jgi:deoxyribonuclease V|nr:endonuclease V [Anaerolineae bacterium]
MSDETLRRVNGVPHRWDVTPAEAVALQRSLAAQLDHARPLDLAAVRVVAGVDVSVRDDRSTAAIVALSFPALEVLEVAMADLPTRFPYVPGLLSFREGEVILAAHARLTCQPDAYLFDGMGRIHPRRIGVASHLGLWLQQPTVGVGKTHLLGEYAPPPDQRGGWSPLTDAGEVLGAVVRTRAGVKPVYVSSGHRIDLESGLALVMACTSRYRLPEPIRAAHRAAGRLS